MKASKVKANTIYDLALLDWREKILNPDDMEVFTKNIVLSPLPSTDSWTIGLLSWPDLNEKIESVKIGYYHSEAYFYNRA